MSLRLEAMTMLSMLLSGMVIGAGFDTYRVFIWRIKIRGWLLVLCDFLFWLSFIFMVFGTLLRINGGVVRIYIFVAIFGGMGLYYLFIRGFYLWALHKIMRFFGWLYRLFKKILYVLLVAPILFIVKMAVALFLLLIHFLWRMCLFFGRGIMFLLGPVLRLPRRFWLRTKNRLGGFLGRMTKWFKR